MNIAYFDCFAGASGDMILGALMDAGLEIERLREELAKLNLPHCGVSAEPVVRRGIGGTQARVTFDADHHGRRHRRLSHIREIIARSDLAAPVRERSIEIFVRLAEAEARVHRSHPEAVHFHEVGAVDAILDVVGSVAGLALLDVGKVFCSPLHLGSGTVRCAHGVLPVPAPATAELAKGVPAYSTEVEGELLTPTGAAILTTLASGFGPMPRVTVRRIGYGAGTADPPIPNLLRVVIGDAAEDAPDGDVDQIAVIETGIDDMNPQIYDHLMGRLLEKGALDVFLTAVQMKKNRPGTLVSILCAPDSVRSLSDLLMKETTTIGLRWRLENRFKARRVIRTVGTRHGPVRVKLAESDGQVINLTPEYDDCKRVSLAKGIPLKQVMEEVRWDAMEGIPLSAAAVSPRSRR